MGRFLVRISAESWERLRELQSVLDLDVFGRTARRPSPELWQIDGLLSNPQVEHLRGLGYEVEIQEDADRVAAERLRELSRDHPSADPE